MRRVMGLIVGLIFLLGMVAIWGWATNLNNLIDEKVLYQRISSFYSSRFWNNPQLKLEEQADESITAEDVDENEATEGEEETVDEATKDVDENTKEDANADENTKEEAAKDENSNDNPESEGNTSVMTIPANYNPEEGTITYTDPETGETVTKTLDELGISQEWLETLLGLGGDLAWDTEHNLLVGYGDDGAKKWEYDPSSHLVAHYEGPKGSERVTVITSEEEADTQYIWASPHTEDPGEGPDGHLVVQRFIYDESGNLTKVQYFTWTAGDRQGRDKARYMYREDTIEGTKITPKYYNDPFPDDWDPVITGTVIKDEYGRFWIKDEKGNMYLITFRVDGFDADKDGKSGAEEANEIDWEALIGKKITVRGHHVMSDSEGGVYYNGEKAEVFEVVDIVTDLEQENYEEIVQQMERVAEVVDRIHQGLVSETPGQTGPLGVINLFNGRIPEAGELTDDQHIPRLMQGLAPVYVNEIGMDVLTELNNEGLIIPELWEAIQNVQQDQNPPEQPPANPEELYGQIWDAFNNNNFEEAQRLAEQFLQNFAGPAVEEENPRGLYGQVGTVYWILAQIAEQQGDVNRAAAYYDLIQQRFPNAQAYDPANDPDQDPTTGDEGWWNVADAARESRANLEEVDEEEASRILEELLRQLDEWINNSNNQEATENAEEAEEANNDNNQEAAENIEEQREIEEELFR